MNLCIAWSKQLILSDQYSAIFLSFGCFYVTLLAVMRITFICRRERRQCKQSKHNSPVKLQGFSLDNTSGSIRVISWAPVEDGLP